MGKLGKALGFDMSSMDADDEAPASEGMEMMPPKEEKTSGNSAELLAMKQFERASTPEAKVQALKDFLEACGVYGE